MGRRSPRGGWVNALVTAPDCSSLAPALPKADASTMPFCCFHHLPIKCLCAENPCELSTAVKLGIIVLFASSRSLLKKKKKSVLTLAPPYKFPYNQHCLLCSLPSSQLGMNPSERTVAQENRRVPTAGCEFWAWGTGGNAFGFLKNANYSSFSIKFTVNLE